MPQSMQAPGDITVRDLVLLGRLPYQGLFSSLGDDDLKAADKALAGTGMTDLQHKTPFGALRWGTAAGLAGPGLSQGAGSPSPR